MSDYIWDSSWSGRADATQHSFQQLQQAGISLSRASLKADTQTLTSEAGSLPGPRISACSLHGEDNPQSGPHRPGLPGPQLREGCVPITWIHLLRSRFFGGLARGNFIRAFNLLTQSKTGCRRPQLYFWQSFAFSEGVAL